MPAPAKQSLSGHEAVLEACPVRLNAAGRGRREVHREEHNISLGDLAEKATAGLSGHRGVPAEYSRPLGLAALKRVMHEVAGDHRPSSRRPDVDAAVAGRMTRRWGQPYRVIQGEIVLHKHRLPCFDHREAVHPPHIAVREFAPCRGRLPERVLAAVKNIFRIGESRYPAAVDEPRVPATVVEVQVGAEDVVDLVKAKPEHAKAIHPR